MKDLKNKKLAKIISALYFLSFILSNQAIGGALSSAPAQTIVHSSNNTASSQSTANQQTCVFDELGNQTCSSASTPPQYCGMNGVDGTLHCASSMQECTQESDNVGCGLADTSHTGGGDTTFVPDGNGKTKKTTGAGSAGSSSLSDCQNANSAAQTACQSTSSIAPMLNQATSLMSGYQTAQASGDLTGACDAMGKASLLQGAINGTFAAACDFEIRSCINKCNIQNNGSVSDDTPAIAKKFQLQCNSYKTNVMMSTLQAVSALANKAQVSTCKKQAAASQCLIATAVNNTACPTQYCSVPTHAGDPICVASAQTAAINCANPLYAGLAQCKSATSATNATGSTAGTLTAGGAATLGGSSLADKDLPSIPAAAQMAANNQNGVAASPANSSGGGYSGGGLPGGSSPGGAGGAPAAGDGKNPEVYMGTGNASTAGIEQYATHDYDPAALQRAAAGDGSMKAFDLNKYLPKQAGLRAPASVDQAMLLKNGITDANGLSNWEKVTRKMREKQVELRK